MQRQIPWPWILLALVLLLAPGPAGRFLLDLLGGLTLLLLLLPLLVGAAGLVGWQLLRRRLRTCSACGFTSLGTEVCPACGTPFAAPSDVSTNSRSSPEMPASEVTIDVDVVEVTDQGA
jgi:rRNA maturation protein Nop10